MSRGVAEERAVFWFCVFRVALCIVWSSKCVGVAEKVRSRASSSFGFVWSRASRYVVFGC